MVMVSKEEFKENLRAIPATPEEIQAAMALDIYPLAQKVSIYGKLSIEDCQHLIAAVAILQQARELKL